MKHTDLDKWFLYDTFAVQGRRHPLSGGRRPLKTGTALTNLRSAAHKHPEVMVKIPKRHSSNSKGMKGIRNHLDYVSRNGKVELETQDGEKLNGKKAVKNHLDHWRDTLGIAEETKHREALNIVLSMPAGTPPQAVLNAAREFAAEQFDGHRYAFGLHHESDDPKEPPHPHVHLCVLLRDSMGQRINPRKNDLFEWRVRFAEKLRDEGVQCAATRRQHRGKTVKGQNGTVRAIDQRLAKRRSGGKAAKSRVSTERESSLKAALQNDRRPDNPYRRKSTDTRAQLVKRYKGLARSLYASGMKTEARDIAKLAQQLAEAGHDTRMQQEYDKQRTALLQRRREQAHKQPETPTPQRPERDNGDIER